MKRIFALSLAMLLLLVSPAFAGVDVQVNGTTVGGSFADHINFTGKVAGTGATNTKVIVVGATIEIVDATTLETLTTADSPRIVVMAASDASAISIVTLPNAAAGLWFQIAAGTQQTIEVNPGRSIDIISYLTLDPGDNLVSAGLTGDSVTIVGASQIWYVVDTGSSAWVDGGP